MEQVKLTRVNGTLKVDIDGEIYEPLSFKSFRPSKRNISDFHKAGVKLFSILTSGITCALGVPYSLFGESWIGDHKYDFEPIDRQIELFKENAPDSYFALMIQLDTRDWWLKAHPEAAYTFTNLSQTISYDKWRQDAADYLTAVIEHVEEKYGDIFYGYFMLCGFTTEWFSHFDEEEAHPIKEAAYKKYLNDDTAVIPSLETLKGKENHSFMPEKDMEQVKTYRKFHAELISDSILYFAEKAHVAMHSKKLLGVYFGYLFELDGPRLWNDGHLAYEKVFTSPLIDMISSPSSYGYRDEDSTSAFMVAYDTLDKHNKLYYLEFDHITNLAPPEIEGILIPGGHTKCKSEEQALNIMQRDFVLCAAKGAALWWFDMFEGWFYSDKMMGCIENMISVSHMLSNYTQKSIAEVLVIASGEALYGVSKNSELNTICLGDQREGLSRMGTPYDVYSACDINDLDLSRYKLVIFLDQFDKLDKDLVARLKREGKTVLWIYAPDFVENGLAGMQNTTEINIVRLIGDESCVHTHFGTLNYKSLPEPRFFIEDNDVMPLGVYPNTEKVAIGMKRFGGWTSIYSAVGNLNGSLLRNIARIAGVHIYSDNDNAPVYVNNVIKAVYSMEDTVLYVEDGVYTEIFTNKEYVAENGRLNVPKGEFHTKLFIKKG